MSVYGRIRAGCGRGPGRNGLFPRGINRTTGEARDTHNCPGSRSDLKQLV